MEMKYRGMEYNLDPVSLERLERDRQATERDDRVPGYNMPRFGQPPAPQPIAHSTNRATHREESDRTMRSESDHRKPIPVPVQMQSPAIVRCPSQTNGAAELHRRNILQSLQRRMRVARATGNRQLIQQLEQEMQMFS